MVKVNEPNGSQLVFFLPKSLIQTQPKCMRDLLDCITCYEDNEVMLLEKSFMCSPNGTPRFNFSMVGKISC